VKWMAISVILIPIISAPLAILIGKIKGKARDYFSVLSILSTFIIALCLIPQLAKGSVSYILGVVPGIEGLVFSLNIDPLGLFMSCLITFLGLLATLYSTTYMKRYNNLGWYYFLLLIFIGAMNGAVLAGDLISFFIFWEIMTVSSFFLVIFEGSEEARKAGIKYFIMTGIGGLLMLFSIISIFNLVGTVSITELIKSGFVISTSLRHILLLLFLIGLGVKAGMVPLHTWLPDAHPAAPSPVSALLSGVMIKVGIYMMVRIFFQICGITFSWNLVISFLGVLTILIGVVFALVQHDVKRLLAFHSISQVGYMILGIGIGTTLGVTGALFHLINHAAFKGLLFLSVGAIIYRTHTRNLEKLGGLAKEMPITFIVCLIAALSISGVPPFNGFASKWMIYQALIEAGSPIYTIFLFAAMFGSALTLASFVKVLQSTFLGQRPKEIPNIREVGWPMTSSMVILALVCVVFGVLAQFPLRYIIGPITGMEFMGIGKAIEVTGIWSPTLATGLIILGIALGLIVYLLGNIKKARSSEAYIGGEIMNEQTMRLPGTQFYDSVKSTKPLAYIYGREEDLDLYIQGVRGIRGLSNLAFNYIEQSIDRFYADVGRLGGLFIKGLRNLHSGLLPTYIFWLLAGLVILLIILMR